MAKKSKKEKSNPGSDKSNEKICAILSYLLIGLIWFAVDEKVRKSSFAKYHVKQGLVLLILDLIIWAISNVPFIGWFIAPILWIGFIILMIIGIINAANNSEKPLPLIGQYASIFKF